MNKVSKNQSSDKQSLIRRPLRVALFEPRIPPNTGNIARTCAAFGLPLDLIEPLGFSLDDRYLKRAGLDYWPHVDLTIHKDIDAFFESLTQPSRVIGCSRRGGILLREMQFQQGDVLLFGREDTGLSEAVRSRCSQITTISMPCSAGEDGQGGVRSLNLSVACAIVSHQAGSQLQLW
ncbi:MULTISPECIES: tRNA (cytidine(34)-2'-O)-methyltransferase [unclassified Synechococcus]|uniref:tRNA (cytidine(34)-2'-O)-methyltransferase n=1 Tax=unclassified Synechococcus TaxID=2626047 RepID=UPI000B115397|nr:tRNA (cytidine(34)-2'-O)-methyltransferase [Synechococcus sp. WH 8020]